MEQQQREKALEERYLKSLDSYEQKLQIAQKEVTKFKGKVYSVFDEMNAIAQEIEDNESKINQLKEVELPPIPEIEDEEDAVAQQSEQRADYQDDPDKEAFYAQVEKDL